MWFYLVLLLFSGFYNGMGLESRRQYICPPSFVRNGNSCYFFSTHMETWQEAHFACRDKGSELARLEKKWEDRNMQNYLNKPEFARLERWIGGIYNWETKHWVWGATGEDLVHQGFSRQNPNTDHKWHCIMMDPTNYYRWNAKSCVHKKHYICETPLKKVRKKGNKKLARKQKKNTNINKSRLAHGDFS